TDNAGNVEGIKLIAFKADSDRPTVKIARPAVGGDYKLGQVVKSSYKCADKASGAGIDTCVGNVPSGQPIDTSTVGTHTFTVTGTDKAGNVTTVNRSYHVHYAWQGFFAPITNASTSKLNLVHAGDLIKLGFGLDGNRGLSIGTVSSSAVGCPSWAPHSIPAAGAGTPTGLTFSTISGHYSYGWQTSAAWAGTCRQFQL